MMQVRSDNWCISVGRDFSQLRFGRKGVAYHPITIALGIGYIPEVYNKLAYIPWKWYRSWTPRWPISWCWVYEGWDFPWGSIRHRRLAINYGFGWNRRIRLLT